MPKIGHKGVAKREAKLAYCNKKTPVTVGEHMTEARTSAQ
jgi:hypothetical protein